MTQETTEVLLYVLILKYLHGNSFTQSLTALPQIQKTSKGFQGVCETFKMKVNLH